jgi:DNA-binding MarR family transcriptional regulator
MTLSDTALVMLAAAAQREDRGIEVPAKLKGAAAVRLVEKLAKEGLIETVRARGSLDEENRALALRITKAGLKAVRVEDLEPAGDIAEGGPEMPAAPALASRRGAKRSKTAAPANGGERRAHQRPSSAPAAGRERQGTTARLDRSGPPNDFAVPPPPMQIGHLLAMCDDTGLAVHSVPHRSHGYCIDDNARALLFACALNEPGEQRLSESLTAQLAAFVQHAWNPHTRRFRNFMSFDRRWLEDSGSEDSHGRALWALGRHCHINFEGL